MARARSSGVDLDGGRENINFLARRLLTLSTRNNKSGARLFHQTKSPPAVLRTFRLRRAREKFLISQSVPQLPVYRHLRDGFPTVN
jgi:hypothetical protein